MKVLKKIDGYWYEVDEYVENEHIVWKARKHLKNLPYDPENINGWTTAQYDNKRYYHDIHNRKDFSKEVERHIKVPAIQGPLPDYGVFNGL